VTTPDYSDWQQPTSNVMLQSTIFSGVIGAGSSGAPLDVSRYESVVVFTQVGYLTADLTFDQAGTKLVQELIIPGGGYPLVCVAPWLTLTNATAGAANVTVIGTNRALNPDSFNVGTNVGWRGHTTNTVMAAGTSYTLLTEVGTLPFGGCAMWVQITTGSTVQGIIDVLTVDGHVLELWDTGLVVGGAAGVGRTGQCMTAVPVGVSAIRFECTNAGTADVRVCLVSTR